KRYSKPTNRSMPIRGIISITLIRCNST
ncbi:uncharacterized protein METZ01_LOCUS230706, partial [marine metagenome]